MVFRNGIAACYNRSMRDFATMLAGGDRRSIGRSDAVVSAVARAPQRFAELWECLTRTDPLVRMRAGDAIEKLTRDDPAPLAAHKKELLSGALDDGTAELRWHLTALVPRLTLTAREAEKAIARCEDLVRNDHSRIVQVMALQSAADLAARHPALAGRCADLLDYAKSAPAAALRARVRKLMTSK